MFANMIWAETSASSPIAIWSIFYSLAGGLLVFVMVRFALHIIRSGDIEAYAKRIADLNPKIVKFLFRVENGQNSEKCLSELALYVRKAGKMVRIATLEETPLMRHGDIHFVRGAREEASLHCAPHSKNEAVLEFRLPDAYQYVFLAYTNPKGQKRKAKILLRQSGEQLLVFHRF